MELMRTQWKNCEYLRCENKTFYIKLVERMT